MVLDAKQKVILTGLSLVSLVVVVFMISSLRTSVMEPEGYRYATKKNKATYQELVANDVDLGTAADAVDSKVVDTDGDGLTNWDEVNLYLTSPYLADSDSDGTSDGDEVRAEQDPNCFSDMDCYEVPLYSETADVPPNPMMMGIGSLGGEDLNGLMKMMEGGGFKAPQGEIDEVELREAFSGVSDAEGVRGLLMESGMPAELLGVMSDAELMEMYSKVKE